jgi:hypothetical protein
LRLGTDLSSGVSVLIGERGGLGDSSPRFFFSLVDSTGERPFEKRCLRIRVLKVGKIALPKNKFQPPFVSISRPSVAPQYRASIYKARCFNSATKGNMRSMPFITANVPLFVISRFNEFRKFGVFDSLKKSVPGHPMNKKTNKKTIAKGVSL